MTRRGKRRWRLWDRVVFGQGDDAYLDRLRIVQTPWVGLYLHHILREDRERDIHDHPWPFASFVLRGGYTEVFVKDVEGETFAARGCAFHYGRPVPACSSCQATRPPRSVRTWRRGSFHRFALHSAHRIVHAEPGTLTLVVVGRPVEREWGFYTPQGRVPSGEYLDRWDTLQGSSS